MGTERAQAVAVENETKKTFTYSGLKFEKKSTFYKMLFRKAAAICLPQRFFYFFFLK